MDLRIRVLRRHDRLSSLQRRVRQDHAGALARVRDRDGASIHAVDKRWRIAEVPIDYRDRPEGSESKLNTFSDGMKVLAMIMSLFQGLSPARAVQLARASVLLAGLIAGIPVIWEFAATGLVPRLPSALLAVALVFVGILAFASGLILDTVVKGTRKEYELQVTQAYERYGRRRA